MKNRPLVIPEPQAHKELNPSLRISRRNHTNAVQPFHLIQDSALNPLLCNNNLTGPVAASVQCSGN